MKDYLQQSIQQLLDNNASPGQALALCVVHPLLPSPFFLFGGAEGAQTSGGEPLDLGIQTPFEIGSITKTFTSTLYYLNNDGTIPYSGILGDHLPGLTLPAALYTMPIQSLANYSSGLASDNATFWMPASNLNTLQGLQDWLQSADFPGSGHPLLPPGTCYSYSNTAWSLLALAALRCESTSDPVRDRYDQSIKSMLSQLSLEMPETGLYQSPMVPNLPLGFDDNGNPFPDDASYAPVCPWTLMFGSGSLVSTIGDMSQWLVFNMGRSLATEWTIMLKAQQSPTWTFKQCAAPDSQWTVHNGWFHDVTNSGKQFLWKDGAVSGFSSYMAFDQWITSDGVKLSSTGVVLLMSGKNAYDLGRNIFTRLTGSGLSDVQQHTGPVGNIPNVGDR